MRMVVEEFDGRSMNGVDGTMDGSTSLDGGAL